MSTGRSHGARLDVLAMLIFLVIFNGKIVSKLQISPHE